MVHHAVSLLMWKLAHKNYSRDKLREGIIISVDTVRALIMTHILYNNKVMKLGKLRQYVKRSEVDRFSKELAYLKGVKTRHLKELLKLGLLEVHYHHYRPTNKGRQEIKKIGLYLSRLVNKYHCQPEKIPTKKKE